MYVSRLLKLSAIGAILLLANACTKAPHNNVLMFGTDTKLALDVSSSATQGGAPEITIGFKRREAVWMPLSENNFNCPPGQDASGNPTQDCTVTTTHSDPIPDCAPTKDSTCLTTTHSHFFQGAASGIDSHSGGTTYERDTYSVFASFGSKFGGGASTGEAKASGGIAQFFATGIAAQRLGANPKVQEALTVKTASATQLSEARAKTEEVQVENEALKAAAAAGKQEAETASIEISLIVACAAPDETTGKATELIDHVKADTSTSPIVKNAAEEIRGKGKNDWEAKLDSSGSIRNAFMVAYADKCK